MAWRYRKKAFAQDRHADDERAVLGRAPVRSKLALERGVCEITARAQAPRAP
jgi:hypothetical protein